MYYTTKSGILDILLVSIHNERTEVLADLMNLYFLAKTLLLPLTTQIHIFGEKPRCGDPKQEKEMRLSITLLHMKRKLVHIYNNVYVCSFLCICFRACNCFESGSDTLHWKRILTVLKDTR